MEEKRKKWRELARRLVKLERRIKELFPLAEPPFNQMISRRPTTSS